MKYHRFFFVPIGTLFFVVACNNHVEQKASEFTTKAEVPSSTEIEKSILNPESTKEIVEAPELEDKDFVESPRNRDPFHAIAKPRPPLPIERQTKAVAKRYNLNELKLVAVVKGQVRATAMFRSPTGRGYMVRRGERISNSHAQVKHIFEDRVVVELATANGNQTAERVFLIPKIDMETTEDTWRFSKGS